jgi:hypothetical protein
MIYCRQLSIADVPYQVSTDAALVADVLHHLFAGFYSQTPPVTPPTQFDIEHTPDGTVIVSQNGRPASAFLTVDEFVSQFEWQLVRGAFDQMHFTGIHSGGVVCKGKTILFPGHSGRGKSTLTLACALLGFGFLTDEMALIQPDTLHVFAFPRVVCIKNGPEIFRFLDTHGALQEPQITRPFNNALCVSPRCLNQVPHIQP